VEATNDDESIHANNVQVGINSRWMWGLEWGIVWQRHVAMQYLYGMVDAALSLAQSKSWIQNTSMVW